MSKNLIYVVDDDELLTALIESFLQVAGYDSRVFHDPSGALEAFAPGNPRPDLLVTDYDMPGMNGLELLERCQKLQPTLKTLTISGSLTPTLLSRASVRPDAMLQKPFTHAQLMATVRRLLSRWSPSEPGSEND